MLLVDDKYLNRPIPDVLRAEIDRQLAALRRDVAQHQDHIASTLVNIDTQRRLVTRLRDEIAAWEQLRAAVPATGAGAETPAAVRPCSLCAVICTFCADTLGDAPAS